MFAQTSDIGETCNIEISKENTIPLFDPSLYGHSEERQRVINTLNKSLGDFKLFNDTINAAPNMNKSVGPTVATSQVNIAINLVIVFVILIDEFKLVFIASDVSDQGKWLYIDIE